MISRNLAAIILLLLLDFGWLSLYMNKKYSEMILNIQGSKLVPRLKYAVMAYILMSLGLVIFVLPNINKNNVLQDSLKYAFLFGVILYGVYDFTAAAVFSKWDMRLAIIDILWGGFVYFITSYLITKFW